ncbi:MAG TPA: hypothetical protein DIW31_12495 [Bacteroidales bacterium]|nr:hypothetical protein [Bacteroidales bacterium]
MVKLYGIRYDELPKVNLSISENSHTKSENVSTPMHTVKLWDEYTEAELKYLRKNEKAKYISLFMVKYGFAPQNL